MMPGQYLNSDGIPSSLTGAISMVTHYYHYADCLAEGDTMTEKPTGIEANKHLVHEFWRTVWEARRMENAYKFVDENMIEHNPNMENGLAGFKKAFETTWTPKPIADELSTEFIFVAERDIVVTIQKRFRPDPDSPSETYVNWWYDGFRVRDGKIVEHWDGRLKEDFSDQYERAKS